MLCILESLSSKFSNLENQMMSKIGVIESNYNELNCKIDEAISLKESME